MTEILLVRHTQAEGNMYRMMQGHWDGDVTVHGWQQIDALAERFKNIKIDAVYSSDLYRARMTAGAALKYHPELTLHTDERIREIDVGPWETEFFGNVFRDHPKEADAFVNHPGSWYAEGAETYADVTARAYPALCEIAARHDGQRVVVVSHGITIRCLMAKILNISLDNVESLPIFSNTSVTTLQYNNGVFTAISQNDCSHLDGLNTPVWRNLASLNDVAINPAVEKDFYCACYADAWKAAHGNLVGYSDSAYLQSAKEHYLADAGSVLKICDKDDPVGLVEMNVTHGAGEGIGWISLIWLRSDYRGKGYGVQLLARALKKYSNMGRTVLRLNVAESNKSARAFYEAEGFSVIGKEERESGQLLLMERKLGRTMHA